MNTKIFLKKNNLTLYMDLILAEARYPILFTCRDQCDDLYICSCYHADGISKGWLFVPTTPQYVIDLLSNKITIRQIFEQYSKEGYIAAKNAGTEEVSLEKVLIENLPEQILPTAGYFMEAEPGEFDEELKILRSRVTQTKVYKNFSFQFIASTYISNIYYGISNHLTYHDKYENKEQHQRLPVSMGAKL